MEEPKKYRVKMDTDHRDIILKYCLDFGPDKINEIKKKRANQGSVILDLTLKDIDRISGWMASTANHTKNRDLEDTLDVIFECLESIKYSIIRDNNTCEKFEIFG